MRMITILIVAAFVLIGLPAFAADGAIERTSYGKPDLSGTYDAGTVTPVDRPARFGDNLYLTPEQAEKMEEEQASLWANAEADKGGGADREAPPVGGDGDNRFGGGGVGGYNIFWIDPGSEAVMIDGKFRTSIIYEPKNGRRPAMTPKAMMKMANNFSSFIHNNDGTASWLEKTGPGPFDGPESLALAERCLLGFSGGPPMLPSLYNNYLSITQTENYVVILAEMVHDARIVRILGEGRPSEHEPQGPREWLGDAIGYWDGDTLVVESKNFRGESGLPGADENLHVTERFSRTPEGDLLYNFHVEDPTSWNAPWSGEYSWHASDARVYEYACHEGNYAMGNILRGARLLESEYDQGGSG